MNSQIRYQDLVTDYWASRFQDIYRKTKELWGKPELVEELGPAELTLAARVAHGLGSQGGALWLLRKASFRFPDSPYTWLYCRYVGRGIRDIFDELIDALHHPTPEVDDPYLKMSWYAYQAELWTGVRRFDLAEAAIQRGMSECGEYPLGLCVQAKLEAALGHRDRAFELTSRAFELEPYSSSIFAYWSELMMERGEESAMLERLEGLVPGTQCYHFLYHLANRYVRFLERCPDSECGRYIAKAESLLDKMLDLAPLADRHMYERVSHLRFWLAHARRDREAMKRLCVQHPHMYPRDLAKHLETVGDSPRFVLHEYRPVRQGHNMCAPASVAMVLSHFDLDIDQDTLAGKLTYAGTKLWRIREWAEQEGLFAATFVVDRGLGLKLLEAGIPFLLSYQFSSYAHAIAVVGYDELTNSFLVHDPNQTSLNLLYRDAFEHGEAPLGPVALVVVPAEQGKVVRDVVREEVIRNQMLVEEAEKAVENSNIGVLENVLTELTRVAGGSPQQRLVEGLVYAERGELRKALAVFHSILEMHPDCKRVQLEIATRINNLADSEEIFRFYEGLMESRTSERPVFLKKLDSQSAREETAFLLRYANFRLAFSHEKIDEIRNILQRCLREDPGHDFAFLLLGKVYEAKGEAEPQELAVRTAYALNPTSDACAEAMVSLFARVPDGGKALRAFLS
ncbi:MAG: hypothetical protein D6820_18980, partial [Lentisphaerae bacterium]